MKKILIVDDDAALRGLYRKRLSSTYELFETGNADEAMALALHHKPDAILLDLRMPKFDGFELCRNFRSLSYTSNLPIFVITGQSANYKGECERLGAAGFFEKPIDFKKLKETLSATLGVSPKRPSQGDSLKMRIPLKITGVDASGAQFTDSVETETVSLHGFQCISTRQLQEKSPVDVFLAGRGDRYIGIAVVEECISADLQRQRYRLKFETKSKDWIIQES